MRNALLAAYKRFVCKTAIATLGSNEEGIPPFAGSPDLESGQRCGSQIAQMRGGAHPELTAPFLAVRDG
jgi:hypothetical protein